MLARAEGWTEWPKCGGRRGRRGVPSPRLWRLLGVSKWAGSSEREGDTVPGRHRTGHQLHHSPPQQMPLPPAFCFCLNTAPLGTCRHWPTLPRKTKQSGYNFTISRFPGPKTANLKNATEAKIRPSMSTGLDIQKQVRPPGPTGSGPHPSPWQPPLASECQA